MKTFEMIEVTDEQRDRYAEALILTQYPWDGLGMQTPAPAAIEDYVLRCVHAYCRAAPSDLLRAVAAMRGDPNPPGLLLLRNLPLDPLGYSPPSGRRADYVKPFTKAENALVGIGAALGQPFGSVEEKDGNLVHSLIPVRGTDKPLSNEGATDFGLHVEDAAFETRQAFLLLYCERADHQRVAATPVADVRDALQRLDGSVVDDLYRDEFVIRRPYSLDRCAAEPVYSEPRAVLSGPRSLPQLRVTLYRDGTRATTDRAGRALRRLGDALQAVARPLRLAPGDCAVLNNRLVAHGRTGFKPRYDGTDRHLLRLYVSDSLWPMRAAAGASARIVRRALTP